MEFTPNKNLYLWNKTDSKIETIEQMAANAQKIDTELTGVDERLDGLDNKSTNELHINEFIAKGTTPSDYTTILQTAIAAAASTKKQLRLEPGKSYKLSSPLVIDVGCSIVSSAQSRAIIYTENQDFDPIQVKGSFQASTTLAASATVNTKWIDVASAAGITAGMLLEIVSSKSWYHDPRPESSDCRKAELHRVDEVVGNRIYLTDPLMDGYDLTGETVTISAYVPIRFHMANIDINMTKATVPNDTDRQNGLTLEHTIDAIVENVYVNGAQNCGIFLKHSYRPTILGGRTEGANNYWSGYGFQTYGTTHALIKGRHVRNCRRGGDVSGGNIPSHFTVIDGCSAFGNGKNSLGDTYVYTDTHATGAAASGFGTHGGADHTIIRNCYMGFLEIGLVDRSRNTIMENNYFVGDFRNACIDVSYGENGIIRDNKVYDGFTGLKDGGDAVYDGGANINTRKAPMFIRYQDTALIFGSSGFYVVEDNFVMVQHTFIEFYGTATSPNLPVLSNFIIRNNNVFFTPQNSVDDAVLIRNNVPNAALILMSGSKVKDNPMKRLSGTGGAITYKGVDMRDGSEIDGPRTFCFYLLDDRATNVDFGAGGTSMYTRVMLDSAFASGLFRLTRGVAGLSAWIGASSTSIDGYSTALTGTTGTDGKINLALLSDGKLYVENRSGSTQRITVTIMNYL